jgi:phosphohistidine phosphatase
MKTLFIIRHGKAEPRGQYGSDADRPLTDEGVEEMKAVGRAMARLTDVALVLTSPLLRARQTADQIVAGFKPPPKLVVLDQLASVSSLRRLAEAINEHPADTVAVVGHEPDMSGLAGFLVGKEGAVAIDFKKGAVCRIDIDDRAAEGAGTLVWLAPPKILRWFAG